MTTTPKNPECLVHRSEYGRCGEISKPRPDGTVRVRCLPKGQASTTNRFAREYPAVVAASSLRKCECGCWGIFSVTQ